jgi:hypothetical protein
MSIAVTETDNCPLPVVSCQLQRTTDNGRRTALRINVVCGDSLLHGASNEQLVMGFDPLAHAYQSEDLADLRRILKPGSYHVVVDNPPYITPKDRALNQAYRVRYSACHGKYSLSAPFMQRIFALAVEGGYTGQITANSFMKREFGKKLIEQFLPGVDLTHVIDTSGAYIPGHGTPTVILFGRNRIPVGKSVRAVLGINGEPSTPSDPARGCVWSAILEQVDCPKSQSKYVSVADTLREKFHRHPWSIGGGGASELKEHLDRIGRCRLTDIVDSIGFMAIVSQEDAYIVPSEWMRRTRVQCKPFGTGDNLRDWVFQSDEAAVFPYVSTETLRPCSLDHGSALGKHFWFYRVPLKSRLMFGKRPEEHGMMWYEFMYLSKDRASAALLLAFASVATHNQFWLRRSNVLLNRHAPVIKLAATATDSEYLALLGLLNSSVACFWMKQVFHNKGSSVDQHGARQTTIPFENFWEHDGTKLKQLPLPGDCASAFARELEGMARSLFEASPKCILPSLLVARDSGVSARRCNQWQTIRQRMIFLQEELDWQCYRLYGLTQDGLTYSKTPPEVELGQRAFEIVMANRMAAGELETTWFERHGSTPITAIPEHWPDDYKRLVERRIELIESDCNIGLIEQPEYKRRWNTEPWDSQLERTLKNWLFDRLESHFDFDGRMNDEGRPTAKIDNCLISMARLADLAAQDMDFMQVAELYRDRTDFDVARLVAELVEDESVPLLPVLRYKPAAMEKRQVWERTWELQRQEDAIDARTKLPSDHPDYIPELAAAQEKRRLVGEIPVPPQYKSTDFQKTTYWQLRGKLDVPKERWVSFPHCEGEDQSLVLAWAGYDHLQLAQAVGTYYAEIKEKGGTRDPRLTPLLACILELVPWLKQWHNDLDPTYNLHMGDYYAGFVEGEAKELEMTVQQIHDWEPPRRTGRRRRS